MAPRVLAALGFERTWQVGQTVCCCSMPNGVRATCVTTPEPLHVLHTRGLVPGFTPEPCGSHNDFRPKVSGREGIMSTPGASHLAGGAGLKVIDSDLLVSAKYRLHEVDLEVQTQIVSLLRPLGAPAPTPAAATTAEESLENVTEWTEISKI
jgi:hypothetical protein